MNKIHPTAIVSKEAMLDSDVVIGPYSVVHGRVKIGKGTRIENHVTIGSEWGVTEIGEGNLILPGAVVGGPPQDLTFKGELTRLEIGHRNTIREFVTLNTGTTKGGGVTRLGDDNLLMAYCHIAHDCLIGNKVVIANSTHFAGHVVVEDRVTIGGGCMFSQFLRVGRLAYIAGDTTANKDILPFTITEGKWAVMRAVNKIGLERAQYSKEEIENIKRAIRCVIMGERTMKEALEKIEQECEMTDSIRYMVEFAKTSKKGLAR